MRYRLCKSECSCHKSVRPNNPRFNFLYLFGQFCQSRLVEWSISFSNIIDQCDAHGWACCIFVYLMQFFCTCSFICRFYFPFSTLVLFCFCVCLKSVFEQSWHSLWLLSPPQSHTKPLLQIQDILDRKKKTLTKLEHHFHHFRIRM